jgi:nucleoid DNA-binding protein
MEIRIRKSRINKKIKTLHLEEYDYRDVINFDNKIGRGSTPYVDRVLRKRLKHVKGIDTHSLRNITYRMATRIFFAYISFIVKALFEGKSIYIDKVGTLSLRTKVSRSHYTAFPKDMKRSKNMGIYTMIHCDYDENPNKFRYRAPFWAFGEHYKKKIMKLEDNGIKY